MKRKRVLWALLGIVLVGIGLFVYRQANAPTLYGPWAGKLFIYVPEASFRETLKQRQYELSLELTFIQAGSNGSRGPGGVLGRLTLQGEPWSQDRQTLEFVGVLEYRAEGPTLTLSADGQEPNDQGFVPSIVLQGKWKGRRIQGVAALSDVPGIYKTLEGEWQVEKVSQPGR